MLKDFLLAIFIRDGRTCRHQLRQFILSTVVVNFELDWLPVDGHLILNCLGMRLKLLQILAVDLLLVEGELFDESLALFVKGIFVLDRVSDIINGFASWRGTPSPWSVGS